MRIIPAKQCWNEWAWRSIKMPGIMKPRYMYSWKCWMHTCTNPNGTMRLPGTACLQFSHIIMEDITKIWLIVINAATIVQVLQIIKQEQQNGEKSYDLHYLELTSLILYWVQLTVLGEIKTQKECTMRYCYRLMGAALPHQMRSWEQQ